jgi:hypothetical protein
MKRTWVSSRTLKRYGKSIDKIYIKGCVFYKDRSTFDRMEVGVFRPSYLTFDHSSAPAFLLVPLEVYSIIANVFLCSAILQTRLSRLTARPTRTPIFWIIMVFSLLFVFRKYDFIGSNENATRLFG